MAKRFYKSFSEAARDRYRFKLFRDMAVGVPAYKDFLKKNGVNLRKIKSGRDLENVPAIGKKNYLRSYPLRELCFDGALKNKGAVYTATSGSTGQPFYFPRDNTVDGQSSLWHEYFLNNVSAGKKIDTLVIDCFGMGVWIGGLITYQAFRKLADKGYPVSIITPGSNKQEIFHALKNIAHHYRQVIICGYPPFVKDLIDESESEGINLKKLNVKLLFAAEGFSEKFREYVSEKVGIKNIFTETANIYGSADLGTMAMETPISILIKREALRERKIFEALFSDIHKIPTLAQFNPTFTDFEIENGNVLCTGRSVLPLFKYDIGDHGGVIRFKVIIEIFKGAGIDLMRLAKRSGIKEVSPLPFVYVYERSDFSTKLYGAIIYPEHIRPALLHESVSESLTGRFTLETVHDDKENQYLTVHVELRPDSKVRAGLEDRACELVVDALMLKNAEYAYLTGMMPGRTKPRLSFWPHEHPEYFRRGGKQKWVVK